MAPHTTPGNVNFVLFVQAPPDWMEDFPALQYEQADEPAALHLSLAFGRESPFGPFGISALSLRNCLSSETAQDLSVQKDLPQTTRKWFVCNLGFEIYNHRRSSHAFRRIRKNCFKSV
jgi:hypothetical protein